MRHAELTRAPIDTAAVLARVGSHEDGAVLLFLGTVRRQHEGRAVSGMTYDAYDAMAADVLRAIVDEAAGQFGIEHIAASHRAGVLELGDVSVAIAVSSPHRAEAYAASRHVIEQIKRRLPVWKQEHYVEGGARWLEGAVPPLEGR